MVCVFLKNFKQQIVKHDPKNCTRQCNEVFESIGNTRKCNKKASLIAKGWVSEFTKLV